MKIAAAQSAADREIVVSHVIDAPRELVFKAFTEVRHLSQWWGPKGSLPPRAPSSSASAASGTSGCTRQTAPTTASGSAGQRSSPPERIAMIHGEHRNDPNAFESTLTFEAEGDTTRLEIRRLFRTMEQRDEAVEKYGAIEGGQETLGNLAAYVAKIARKGDER